MLLFGRKGRKFCKILIEILALNYVYSRALRRYDDLQIFPSHAK